MRYDHGLPPRNPLNMIIQENHVASRAYYNYIIFGTLISYYFVEEIYYPSHAINHQTRQDITE